MDSVHQMDVPIEVRLYCRLIAFHNKPKSPNQSLKTRVLKFEENKDVELFICRKKFVSRHLTDVDLGNNIKCGVYVRQIRCLSSSNDSEIESVGFSVAAPVELIFTFSWFAPRGPFEFASLGLKMLSYDLKKHNNTFNDFYFDLSRSFVNSPFLMDLLTRVESGEWLSNGLSSENNGVLCPIQQITFTGFSLGGVLSQAVAYQFDTLQKFEGLCGDRSEPHIRVVSLGGGRPGGSEFAKWYKANLQNDSMNIVLALRKSRVDNKIGNREDEGNENRSHLYMPERYSSPNTPWFGNKDAVKCWLNDIYLDPHTMMPPHEYNYVSHPNGYVLFENKLSKVGGSLEDALALYNPHAYSTGSMCFNLCINRSIFDASTTHIAQKMHSILKYYENMF